MKFADIPQFPNSHYNVHVDLNYLKEHLKYWNKKESPLILNPDFQRGHVWTPQQQTDFMEYFLKGGTSGTDIYFNCSSWMGNFDTPIICVDGLQRLTAATDFLDNKVKVFGYKFSDFTDRPRIITVRFNFHVAILKTKKEVLQWYIGLNTGGTVHNPAEIARVEKMLETCGNEKI